MKHRPIPEALKRQSGTTQKTPPPKAVDEAPGLASPIHLYLFVPDKRFLAVLKQKARVFSSMNTPTPLTLTVFYGPDLPNLPTDSLQLLGTLTEYGDVEGIEVISLTPEPTP